MSSSSSVSITAPMLSSPSDPDYYTQLTQLIKDKHSWYSEFEFNESPGIEDPLKYIDFSAEVTSQSPYMFPSHFDGIENKDELITALRVVCIKSGFNVIQRSSESKK